MPATTTPTKSEIATALKALSRHGVDSAALDEVGHVLTQLRQVRSRIQDGVAPSPEDAIVDALREAAGDLSSPQKTIVEIVLALDPTYRGKTARARREIAGREFRGGTRPVSAETIRQYHEPQAMEALAARLLDRDLDVKLGREPSGGPLPRGSAPTPLTSFVIGPIGNRHGALGTPERQTYEDALTLMEDVIKPACGAVGLSPVRADDLAVAGEITDQIFRRLRDDDVVIADLTDANPNVMYELGLRHTRAKLTVQIGEFGRLPFDVSTIRTIQFSRSPVGLIKARDELLRVLEVGLAGEYDPVAATRVWTAVGSPPGAPDHFTETEPPAEEASDDRGFVDVLAEAEEHQGSLVAAVEAVGRCLQDLAELAQKSTAEAQRSDAAGKGMRGRLQVATRYAEGLDSVSGVLSDAVEEYVTTLGAFGAGTDVLIGRMEADSDNLTEGEDFGKITRRLAATTRGSLGGLAGMVESMKEVAQVSRVLREPTRRVTEAIERFAAATAVIDDWDRRLESLGIPVPPDQWDPEEASK